jgi:hypothetical protein
VAALSGLTLAHGGTAGLVVEATLAIAVALVLLWAARRSRRESKQ